MRHHSERHSKDGPGDLYAWLEGEQGGVGTYVMFQRRALDVGRAHPDHAAAMRLLADLAYQFAQTYDGMPLPIDVAKNALDRLRRHVSAWLAVEGERDRLALLNRIALDQLGVDPEA